MPPPVVAPQLARHLKHHEPVRPRGEAALAAKGARLAQERQHRVGGRLVSQVVEFSPGALPRTVRDLHAAQPEEHKPDEAARQEIAECDAKLKQHRAALEAGADPVLVTSWMKETQARRVAAEAKIRKPTGRRRMTTDEITNLVTALGDLLQVLKDADPADRAEVYSRLGLTLTYHPEDRKMEVEMRPNLGVYVGKCPRINCTKKPMASHSGVSAGQWW